MALPVTRGAQAAVEKSAITVAEATRLGREVIAAEAAALGTLVDSLDNTFHEAVCLLHALTGNLIVTGMGKAGHIGKKLAATFASTGTRAFFLHPAEAIHGDLGRVQAGDIVLVLSQSGETGEIVEILPSLKRLGAQIIAVTATKHNTLGQTANVTLELGSLDEACSLGLAPSTSTTAMLALGDALALVVSHLHGFQAEDFAVYHPGGSLGRKLSHVEEHMRPLAECRVAHQDHSIRQVLVDCTKPGRRSGAIMLVDDAGRLTGLFTDSDLARLIEHRHDQALDQPVRDVMKRQPTTVDSGAKMTAAIDLLVERKISELPVVDAAGSPLGMIDVTDVVGMLPPPADANQESPEPHAATVRIFSGDQP